MTPGLIQPDTTSVTLSRTRLTLLLFAIVTSGAIFGQTWWAIAQDKRQTLTSETANGLVAVRLLEEHASQTFQNAVHTLDRLARAVQLSRDVNDIQAIQKLVASHDIGHSPYLKALQYVSPDGTSWISSTDFPTHTTQASQHEHILYLLNNPTDQNALVGHPYASSYDSQWVIPVARTLYNSQGESLGVVGVDIRLAYFGALYTRVAKENNAIVTLLSDQGFILARSPFEARYVNRDVSDETRLATLRSLKAEGSFEDEEFLDDDPGNKLYAFRKLGSFPVTTVYARDYVSVLALWERRTLERITLAGAMIALLAALTYFLNFYIHRLQRTQHSLRESEAKFFGLFRQSPVPLTLVHFENGQFVETNDAWLQQYGYQLEDVIGRTSVSLGIWEQPSQRNEVTQALNQNGRVDRLEVTHRHRDGRIFTCLLSGRTIQSGANRLILVSLIDVTLQRLAEQEIKDMNQQLELRVQARTEKLEIANHDLNLALESVHAMQTELVRTEKLAALGSLVAGVAHELNTPIGNSVTVGSTLQHRAKELLTAFNQGELRRSFLKDYIDSANRGTEILMHALTRANELIGSFKRVAVDQSSDQRRVFDLQTTLKEICLTLEPMYKNTPFRLTVDLPEGITMDSFPGALGQLITNFLSNAQQHGFEGQDAGLMQLRAHAEGAESVQLHFTDDGVGMTEEVRKRVFDPFFTTKLGQGGSGLGMNIVYNIVHEVMGGSIDIASEPGAGTHITVTLPRSAPRVGAQHG